MSKNSIKQHLISITLLSLAAFSAFTTPTKNATATKSGKTTRLGKTSGRAISNPKDNFKTPQQIQKELKETENKHFIKIKELIRTKPKSSAEEDKKEFNKNKDALLRDQNENIKHLIIKDLEELRTEFKKQHLRSKTPLIFRDKTVEDTANEIQETQNELANTINAIKTAVDKQEESKLEEKIDTLNREISNLKTHYKDETTTNLAESHELEHNQFTRNEAARHNNLADEQAEEQQRLQENIQQNELKREFENHANVLKTQVHHIVHRQVQSNSTTISASENQLEAAGSSENKKGAWVMPISLSYSSVNGDGSYAISAGAGADFTRGDSMFGVGILGANNFGKKSYISALAYMKTALGERGYFTAEIMPGLRYEDEKYGAKFDTTFSLGTNFGFSDENLWRKNIALVFDWSYEGSAKHDGFLQMLKNFTKDGNHNFTGGVEASVERAKMQLTQDVKFAPAFTVSILTPLTTTSEVTTSDLFLGSHGAQTIKLKNAAKIEGQVDLKSSYDDFLEITFMPFGSLDRDFNYTVGGALKLRVDF